MRISPPPRITFRIGDKGFYLFLWLGQWCVTQAKTRFRNILSRIVAETIRNWFRTDWITMNSFYCFLKNGRRPSFYLCKRCEPTYCRLCKSELEKAFLKIVGLLVFFFSTLIFKVFQVKVENQTKCPYYQRDHPPLFLLWEVLNS